MNISRHINKVHPSRVIDALAWRLYTKDNFKQAIFLWKLAEKLSFRLCATYGGLARSYFHLASDIKSNQYFLKLVSQEKQTATDWRHFEQVALVLGKEDLALTALKEARVLDSDDEIIISNLLTVFTRRKLAAEATQLINEIAKKKYSSELIIQIVESLITLGESQLAIKKILEARDRILPDVFSHLMFKTFIVTQDSTIASDICKHVTVDLSNFTYFQTLAGCLYRLNQLDLARVIVKQLLNFNITEKFVSTAIMILMSVGDSLMAKKVVTMHVKDPALACMLNIWIEQASSCSEKVSLVFNDLMRLGNFNQIYNFHLGISRLSFEPLTEKQLSEIRKLENSYKRPLVSIILTCYNDEKYLQRALASILAQGITNFELFIVDDASNDNTFKIACEYAAKDRRIKALKNAINSGPYFSKNRAIQMAKGEFLAFHDADDVSHPQRLVTQINTLIEKKSQRVFAVICYHIRICENSGKLIERSFNFLTPSPISLVMPRAEFLRTYGAFDCVRAGGDSELIRRIQAHQGDQAVHLIEYPLYLASYREGSLTTDAKIGICNTGSKDSVRNRYRFATDNWHALIREDKANPYKSFPELNSNYEIPLELQISKDAIAQL